MSHYLQWHKSTVDDLWHCWWEDGTDPPDDPPACGDAAFAADVTSDVFGATLEMSDLCLACHQASTAS